MRALFVLSIASAFVGIGMFGLNRSENRNRFLLESKRFADPVGFNFDNAFHHRYGPYLFISDHELLVKDIGSLRLTSSGILNVQENTSMCREKSGEQECKGEVYKVINLKSATSSQIKWNPFRSVSSSQNCYVKAGERKSYFANYENVYSVTLNGKRTIVKESANAHVGRHYWSRVKGYVDEYSCTVIDGPHAGRRLVPDDTFNGQLISILSETADGSLIVKCNLGLTGNELCVADLVSGKLKIGDPILKMPQNMGNIDAGISLDGNWIVAEIRNLPFHGPSTVVAIDRKKNVIHEVGKLDGQYLNHVLISPSNDYIVIETPGGLYWKRFSDLKPASASLQKAVLSGSVPIEAEQI